MSAMYASRCSRQGTHPRFSGGANRQPTPANRVRSTNGSQLPISLYRNLVDCRRRTICAQGHARRLEEHASGRAISREIHRPLEHIADKCYIARTEHFERWYENAIDLPRVATICKP